MSNLYDYAKPQIAQYRGKKVDEMTKEELMKALSDLANTLDREREEHTAAFNEALG